MKTPVLRHSVRSGGQRSCDCRPDYRKTRTGSESGASRQRGVAARTRRTRGTAQARTVHRSLCDSKCATLGQEPTHSQGPGDLPPEAEANHRFHDKIRTSRGLAVSESRVLGRLDDGRDAVEHRRARRLRRAHHHTVQASECLGSRAQGGQYLLLTPGR